MHKSMVVLVALLAAVLAAPQGFGQQPQSFEAPQGQAVQILKHEQNINPDGYQFEYETSDGTARQEQGVLKQVDEDHQALEVTGNYRYIAPDGLLYSVTFVANEHGFQPQERVEHPGQAPANFQQ